MRIASRFSARSGLAITLFWAAALALSGSTDALLFLAPALLIAIPLCGGRYVGEELIAQLVARRERPSRRPASSPRLRVPAAPVGWRPRGTRLLAFSLAKRPPPLPRLLPQIR